MEKLIYGKNGQVHFDNVTEKREAIEYILTSSNVDFNIHEDNQFQNAENLPPETSLVYLGMRKKITGRFHSR